MTINATVTKSFKWRGVVQEVGTVIQIPADRLSQFEKFISTDGRNLPNYCRPADCWCSERLTLRNYPAGCIAFNCKHHKEAQP